jgi:myo-inositol-hexaphosphate 3-phosphohydrolase
MKFEELIGKELKFYGVDGNTFKLENTVFEALENEDDGYRSYLKSVEVKDPSGLIFFRRSIAKVRMETGEGDFDGFRLVDVKNGHTWLRLGTDRGDCYYPHFVFEYTPKTD